MRLLVTHPDAPEPAEYEAVRVEIICGGEDPSQALIVRPSTYGSSLILEDRERSS